MALKTILVALTTMREIDGKNVRVRFAAKSVVDLTSDEQDSLQKLQNATGKLHFRDPVNEGGKVQESKPQVIGSADSGASYEGSNVAIGDKSVQQLKAYLDHYSVEYKGNASKADLVTLAETHAATAGSGDGGSGTRDGEGGGDPDAGL